MKIALIAPIDMTIPPKKYGGIEWIVYYLAHHLGKKGHEIDLFASSDSLNEKYYKIIPIVEKHLHSNPLIADNIKLCRSIKLISSADTVSIIERKRYDIIHNHASWEMLLFSKFIKYPLITTHHGPLNLPYQDEIFLEHKNLPYVSISSYQRKALPELNFVATIYNGIDLDKFPYFEHKDPKNHEYMTFLARLSPEKGAIQAAQTAIRTEKLLKVASKVDIVDKAYFEEFKHFIKNKYVNFIGEIDSRQRINFLQNARCLLVPINWEEPFGLMFIEAMATGTPVITFARGSVPEVIKDGKTGFIVNSSNQDTRGDWIVKKTGIDGLCEAVEKIYSMPKVEYLQMRKNCRAHVEKNFTAERMVDNYEKVYQKILAKK